MGPNDPAGPVWRRVLWFATLWAAGVAAVATLGFLIRACLPQ